MVIEITPGGDAVYGLDGKVEYIRLRWECVDLPRGGPACVARSGILGDDGDPLEWWITTERQGGRFVYVLGGDSELIAVPVPCRNPNWAIDEANRRERELRGKAGCLP